MQRRRSSYIMAAVIGLVAAALALLLCWPGSRLGLVGQALWRAELLTYDFRLANSVPQTASDHVVVVTIDERSIASVGTWPWPRSYHAKVISNIAEAGAKLIGVDLILSTVSGSDVGLGGAEDGSLAWEPEPSADDLALAEAVAEAGNVVLAISMAKSRAHHGEMAADVIQADFPYWRFEEAAYGMGVVNMPKDLDGAVRRCWMQRTYQDEPWPTMPLLLAAEFLGTEASAQMQKVEKAAGVDNVSLHGDSFAIAYRGRPGVGIKRIPYWQVLRGKFNPAEVAGKIVLIGATDPALQDMNDTPVTLGGQTSADSAAGEQMPGVEIMANAIDTIVGERYIKPASPVVPVLLTGLLAIIVAVFEVRLRPLWSLGLLWLPAMAASILLAFFLFQGFSLWLLLIAPLLGVMLSYAGTTVYLELTTERQRRHLHRSWSQRVSTDVLSVILDNPAITGVQGKRVVATVMFTDLRGFTTFCHESPPEQVVETLDRCLALITRSIRRHGGTVHKFIGDGVLAVFGDPVAQPDHAHRAVLAARDMQQEMARLRESMRECPWVPHLRVGIDTGELVAGDIGSGELLEYTVIGDPVSTASRLEELNKEYETEIIISKSTQEAAGPGFRLQALGMVRIRGQADELEVFAVDTWRSSA